MLAAQSPLAGAATAMVIWLLRVDQRHALVLRITLTLLVVASTVLATRSPSELITQNSKLL